MLKTLSVDNFKSLCDFKIEFGNLNVLIGSNSAGKSTVLHAIDLLPYLAQGNLKDYLESRNWEVSELKSKLLPSKKNITFSALFELDNQDLEWSFTLIPRKEDEALVCTKEKVILRYDEQKATNTSSARSIIHNGKILLNREGEKIQWYDATTNRREDFPPIQLNTSVLSLINVHDMTYSERFPELTKLKRFVTGIKSFEMLSPDKMKKTSRYGVTDFGMGGERLAAFIHGLSLEDKTIIVRKLKRYYPAVQRIVTSKKKYGHVSLKMDEEFDNNENLTINANYISDGLLRIIAIVSLRGLNHHYTVLLLDEIEDGINPSLAAELTQDLKETAKQVFVTTHSPIMLNYFDEESIIFLWRQDDGKVRAEKMFNNEKMRDHLKYMNPGEVWLNMEPQEIQELLKKSPMHSGGQE